MTIDIAPYPLNWPISYGRTKNPTQSRFGKYNSRVTIAKAVNELLYQLTHMGVDHKDIVISSNLRLRRDGLPHSDQAEPKDSGVAVYWCAEDGSTQVLPSDRWARVADNIYAAALAIEAMRGIDRWVSGQVQKQAFSGLAALTHQTGYQWWDVLEVDKNAPTNTVIQKYRSMRFKAHPDQPGGSDEAFKRLAEAYDNFRHERGL